jgi:hypothetical protein
MIKDLIIELLPNFHVHERKLEDLKTPCFFDAYKILDGYRDYVLKKELKSELNNETYYPEDYFINYLKCIE